jgi:hypothetical protein
MSKQTWPERYARLDHSFDRSEWRKQYEQQWPIECDHAKEVGRSGSASISTARRCDAPRPKGKSDKAPDDTEGDKANKH